MSKRDDEERNSMTGPVIVLIIAIFIALAAGATSVDNDDFVGVCTEARAQLGC